MSGGYHLMSKNFNTMPDSRLDVREKKRKINKFYNIAITLVVVLIVVVGLSIFLSGKSDSDTAAPAEKTPKETNTAATADDKEKEEAEKATDEDKDAAKDESAEEKATEDEAADDSKTEDDSEAKLTEVEDNEDENVDKAYTSDDWEPVGTEQSGEHVTSFDKGSSDWKEMTTALSSSTGIDESNMTIWRLGNGGAPNKATGTVSGKNDDKTYRVQLEWVDGSGWRAAKVEELKKNDQR